MKLPYMQFYPGDWWREGGLRALDIADRGMWFEMLLTMHESPQRGRMVLPDGQPIPDESVARMIGLDTPRYREGLARLIKFGVAGVDSDGVVFCRRMIREEEKRVNDEENGRKGWEKRKNQPKAIPPPIPPPSKTQIPQGIPLSSSSSSKEPPTPLSPIEKWTELLCETHPGVCDPRFPATFCEDNWHRLREDAERFNVFMGQVFDGLRAHCEYWAIEGNRFAISLDKWLLGGGWKKAPPKRVESATAPGNYDHLPLGFTQAEKDKMARVERERAEDGLQ